jgi:(2S)-methylsuccinyl-CoA dehydrogenase
VTRSDLNEFSALASTCQDATTEAIAYLAEVRKVVELSNVTGKAERVPGRSAQHELHGLAWIATYVEALGTLLNWAQSLDSRAKRGALEQLILVAGFAEYLAQLGGGIPMSPGETIRPADFGIDPGMILAAPAASRLIAQGGSGTRNRIAALIRDAHFGDPAYGDDALELMVEQFRRLVSEEVAPAAHAWHLANAYIPFDVIEKMSALGVFGLTIPEAWGGMGLGKLAMCLASEELSRGYIGVGSLGTRSEIAGELIQLAGTEEQKRRYLARIATGELLPTAVFTEPNVGSDLASVMTRADLVEKSGGRRVWRVTGNKTWITHAARADVMTLLVRTNPDEPGYRGLSMLIAEKPRGDATNPFPVPGMSGSEIEVLGYRGMKEFEIRFDGFEVPADNLLGGKQGQGFKQLMETFESARIQTAARAVGVAQNALELGLRYAVDRIQFGEPLFAFPRVSGKLAWMAVETMMARQLCYSAAREKDQGKRCDIRAGMAKLLAARVAWTNADNALQIHGGNGFALEYAISRVLCDARVLSIFEGSAEVQAQVIARGILARRGS